MYPDWIEMTNEVKNEKGKELMKKWKAVRDLFVKDLRQQKTTSTGQPTLKKKCCICFDHLQFLLPIIGDRK